MIKDQEFLLRRKTLHYYKEGDKYLNLTFTSFSGSPNGIESVVNTRILIEKELLEFLGYVKKND